MIGQVLKYRATFTLIIIWTALFILNKPLDLVSRFSSQGIDLIGHQYYRFLTGPLLHFNFVHLLVNIIAIFWVGYFLENSIGSIHFFTFGLVSSTIVECLYSFMFASSRNNIGGSVWAFSFIGLIIVLQLFKPEFPRFRLGTHYGNWILGYAILGNVPVLSFMTLGTVITHGIALAMSLILGAIAVWLRII